jgi:hypothetical protein
MRGKSVKSDILGEWRRFKAPGSERDRIAPLLTIGENTNILNFCCVNCLSAKKFTILFRIV